MCTVIRLIQKYLTILLPVIIVVAACAPIQASIPASNYDATIPLSWFNLSLKLVQETSGFSPPVASRAFGYLGVTLYQAVQPGMPGYATLAGQLNKLPELPVPDPMLRYHWLLAANHALAAMMRRMFPTASPQNLAAMDTLESHWDNQLSTTIDRATYQASIAWGETIANAIYIWSLSDGGNEGYDRNFPEEYLPPEGAGAWVSTPPGYLRALQPYWGQNRPFVLQNGSECPAPPPLTYSERPGSAFYLDALEVYKIGKNRTPEQTQIALFWADNPGETATPPGHWVSILDQLISQHPTLDFAAVAYAKLGMALADSFITCWHTKYLYNVVRPITYIQQVIDPTWNMPDITDPLITPPFPEYTSGHSVQSAAAAIILTDLFGENFAFTDRTHVIHGDAPRDFSSFNAAAEEAAISRLYAGIHYRSAIENGSAQGQCVASKVLALHFHG